MNTMAFDGRTPVSQGYPAPMMDEKRVDEFRRQMKKLFVPDPGGSVEVRGADFQAVGRVANVGVEKVEIYIAGINDCLDLEYHQIREIRLIRSGEHRNECKFRIYV